MARVTVPLEVRFWRHVTGGDYTECWQWTGAVEPSGYGRVFVAKGVCGYAHRVAYEIMVGEIPDGLQLDHRCRNRACVNVFHLEPVTPLVNTRRGEGHGSETHCPKGHAYDEANTRWWRDRRICITCNIERCREWRKRKQAA